MNVVKYTDDEFILEQLLDDGFTLDPAFEPDEEPTDGVDDKEPDEEPTDGVDDKEPDEEPTREKVYKIQ